MIGKNYEIYSKVWNTEHIFRLIQSIPSKKAEPFKLWLAKVGYDRVKEIWKKVSVKKNYLNWGDNKKLN